ncbi:MAG TPA: heparinase II/III family protein, partial [Thermomicrobiales bacterium]|nr:heparinase II/III family protein [Thermomicrobiales bacterium]
ELDERTVARLLKTILGAARWLAEEHDTFRHGNWQHHGVTGLFELATFWPEFREAPEWAALAWQRLLDHLELDVYADGGHLERAPSYHAGVLDGYQRVALAAEFNWSARLQDQPRFPAMYHWLLTQSTPPGVSTNFNDSGPVWVGPYLAQGAVVCGDPELKWVAERLGTTEEINRTLSKLPDRPDGTTAASVFAALPSREPVATSSLLSASKFAIMRGGWDQHDLYLSVSYGPLVGHELESHSHLDPLSFIAFGHGRPLAIEAGCPASYDDPRYHDWYQAARSHNLVVVDGAAPAPDQKDGQLLHWSTSPVADIFQATHDGYRQLGVNHRRTIVFLRGTGWLVHDELQSDGRHHYAWQIFSPTPLRERDGTYGPNGEPGLIVQPILGGADVERTQGVMVVPGSAAYEGTDERREVEGLRLVRDSESPRACFFVLLTPSEDTVQSAIGQVAPVPDGAGEAAMIETGNGQTLVAIASGNQRGSWTVNDWTSDARVWLSRADGAWVVCDGSRLTRSDSAIVATSAPVDSIACWPVGNGWAGEVSTRRRTTIHLGAIPTWCRIVLNGVTVPTTDAGDTPSFLVPAAGTYLFRVESA